eukprot:UN32763
MTEGGIGDHGKALEADFANKYIGGGAIGGGNVQEEIMFAVRPECMLSCLLCEMMKPNEAIIIIGSELFNEHKGYGGGFRWSGPHKDKTELIKSPVKDSKCKTLANVIVAIDAIQGGARSLPAMTREMIKAYSGFSISNKSIGVKFDVIETGNWGCGMFGGYPPRKAMVQWIAASLCSDKRSII